MSTPVTSSAGNYRSDFPSANSTSVAELVRDLQRSGVLHDGAFENSERDALAKDILFNGRNCANDRSQVGQFIAWCASRNKPETFGPLLARVLVRWGVSDLTCHDIGGTRGAYVIAQALKNGLQLQSLRLTHCAIDDPGASEIAQALAGNTSLQTLVLDGNKLSQDSVPQLLAMIHGCAVTELSLKNNQIGPKSQLLLCEAWRHAGKLQWPEPDLRWNRPQLHLASTLEALRKAEYWSSRTGFSLQSMRQEEYRSYDPAFSTTLTESLPKFACTGELPQDDRQIILLAAVISQFAPYDLAWLHEALETQGKTKMSISFTAHESAMRLDQQPVQGIGAWLAKNPPLHDLTIYIHELSAKQANQLAAGLKHNDELRALYVVQTNSTDNCPGHAAQFESLFMTNTTLLSLDVSSVRQLNPQPLTSQEAWPYDEDRVAVQTITGGLLRNGRKDRFEGALCMHALDIPNDASDQILNHMRWIVQGAIDDRNWKQ